MNLYHCLSFLGIAVWLVQSAIAGEPLRAVSGPGAGFQNSRSGGGNSYLPTFSPEGNYLVYLSEARNLVTNDSASPYLNIYMYNLATGSNTLVSAAASGIGGGNENSGHFTITSNAQLIAFDTTATNIGELRPNQRTGTYLRSTRSNTTSLAAYPLDGLTVGGFVPLISPSGRWFYFQADLNRRVIVAHDFQNDTTALVSTGLNISPEFSILQDRKSVV
jgi:hypothetical protein